MRKKNTKKWSYFLLAIFVVILAMGCTDSSEVDTSIKSATESKSGNSAPIITVKNQTVDYGTELRYADLANVEDNDSEDVRLSIANTDLSGITVNNDSQTIVLGAVGNFEIELTATDEEGNVSTEKVLIAVKDNVAPTLILTSKAFSMNTGDNEPNYASVAKASDNVDGDISGAITIDTSKVNYHSAGTYEVTYTVVDSSGNATSQKATVTIVAKSTSSNDGDTSSTIYVLITKTGECYHTRKCGNGNFFEVTLEEALRRGLRKCEKCY